MTIIDRTRVRAAVERALLLDPDLNAAIEAAAQALSLPIEAVQEAMQADDERMAA
jgi:hypothetical protein